MDQKESIRLWHRCQAKKRDILEKGFSEEEANNQVSQIWNEWANQMLIEYEHLKDDGLWQVVDKNARVPVGTNDETESWLIRAKVDFSRVLFERAKNDKNLSPTVSNIAGAKAVHSTGEAINFTGYTFPGTVSFEQAVFDGWAWFRKTEFKGPTTFDSAQFLTWVGFQGTKFRQRAWLKEVTFTDHGIFTEAEFHKDTTFYLSEFKLGGNFNNANFYKIGRAHV